MGEKSLDSHPDAGKLVMNLRNQVHITVELVPRGGAVTFKEGFYQTLQAFC
jgi:hypothetical protein